MLAMQYKAQVIKQNNVNYWCKTEIWILLSNRNLNTRNCGTEIINGLQTLANVNCTEKLKMGGNTDIALCVNDVEWWSM